jgi:hypothetical protein
MITSPEDEDVVSYKVRLEFLWRFRLRMKGIT